MSKEVCRGSSFAPKERYNGDRTVGRIREIDCLKLREGPFCQKLREAEAEAKRQAVLKEWDDDPLKFDEMPGPPAKLLP